MSASDSAEKKNEITAREEEMLAFWKARDIFKRSVEKEAPRGDFVFYEGPPTANGHPGIHHLEARAFKDAIPRYKTMRGYRVRRRGGWDTHGLPVELQVEKALGFSGKKDIEAYGIAEFNKKCRESVLQYIDEWSQFTDRIGYWVDQENAYFTFASTYIESLWSIVKKVNDDGLLYKDYKVVPWCARCGTALSSHELAQGYADVKDLSVTVKFQVLGEEKNSYLLAWTTTPWTLPGNVALAVGKDIVYGTYEKDGEKVTLADTCVPRVLPEGWKKVGERKGAELVGLRYAPPFPFLNDITPSEGQVQFEKAYQVYAADFVTTEDGTGIVHTAVMYGHDDFELGTSVGLPKIHIVGADGRFVAGTDFLAGRFVKDEEVAIDIVKHLAAANLLFSKSKYEHSYPFCWRCKTPLIYYARDSWYIRMSALREKLIEENSRVRWEPEHIQEGRFGEWLHGIKDWAISRERYWGTPLPIWENTLGTERLLIGSLEDLRAHSVTNGNTFFVMRHGDAEHIRQAVISARVDDPYALTELGKDEALRAAEILQSKKITKIVTSPFVRTKETATIVKKALGLPDAALVVDDRLEEIQLTSLSGMSVGAYFVQAPTYEDRFVWKPEGGETLGDVKRRAGALLYDLEKTHKNENILLVTHEYVAWMLQAISKGLNEKQTILLREGHSDFPKTGEVLSLDFVPLPHDENYTLDLHRPFIDDHVLRGNSGEELRRVKEVMDVWFDSGAMPFAQDHYPFEAKSWIDGPGYPAHFISEAIDQTRGWFYTLLAVGVLMGKGTPYLNVICLGHLLDDKGQKMSKSKGNIVDPWSMIEKYGVDVLRLWMYTVNAPGDSKNFDERTVDELSKKVIGRLHNSLLFYNTYGSSDESIEPSETNILDRWILARLGETRDEMTEALDQFALDRGTRPLIGFIDDLSNWYIRRARDRFRGDDINEKKEVSRTTRYVLREFSKLLAPFMPFYAEFLWQRLRSGNDVESVHLESWPEGGAYSETVLSAMSFARSLVSKGLMERSKGGVKVRQPLQSITIQRYDKAFSMHWDEILPLIKDELNVKEVIVDETVPDFTLDTIITPELREEGDLRELLRAIQDARKDIGVAPGELVDMEVQEGDLTVFIEKYQAQLKKNTSLRSIRFVPELVDVPLHAAGISFVLKK